MKISYQVTGATVDQIREKAEAVARSVRGGVETSPDQFTYDIRPLAMEYGKSAPAQWEADVEVNLP